MGIGESVYYYDTIRRAIELSIRKTKGEILRIISEREMYTTIGASTQTFIINLVDREV